MKSYSFRLERVRQMRRVQEGTARMELAVANRHLREAIELRDKRAADYAMMPATMGVQDYEVYARERGNAELAAMALASAQQSAGVAAGAVASCQIAWVEAKRRVSMLDRLDDRQKALYRLEENRQEVKEIDDIVAARYASNGYGYVVAESVQQVGEGL
ncbi:MAG: flagellar FliJ family protein [Actinobacteria bacterium]|nr:flagellar FliJ family protein [Actinomycetota bacterium]